MSENGPSIPKVATVLDPFNGKPGQYRLWSSRVRGPLTSKNLAWARLLKLTEKQRMPLTLDRLAGMTTMDNVTLDLPTISNNLWAFLRSHGEQRLHEEGAYGQR